MSTRKPVAALACWLLFTTAYARLSAQAPCDNQCRNRLTFLTMAGPVPNNPAAPWTCDSFFYADCFDCTQGNSLCLPNQDPPGFTCSPLTTNPQWFQQNPFNACTPNCPGPYVGPGTDFREASFVATPQVVMVRFDICQQ